MSTSRRLLPLAAVALLAAACSSTGASPSSSANPSGSPVTSPSDPPSASPAVAGLEHPTGKNDIVLRYEEGGGFVMPAFLASRTPIFTLYGDGTIVFQRYTEEAPPTLANGAMGSLPLRIAKLSEEQMQEVLRFALTDGGLAIARPKYDNQMVADAGTAFFVIDAGGVDKTVEVYALGMDVDPNQPDALARIAFSKLADRLRDFDQKGTIPTDEYVPTSFRGTLIEGGMGGAAVAWPWKDLKVTDFVAPPADQGGFPKHTLTPDQVTALGIKAADAAGGLQGINIQGPDGKLYSLAIRPLLPDETS
jgi:hypothetical protein